MPSISKKSDTNKYSRVVIKAGTSLLTNGLEGLDEDFMNRFVDQISHLHQNGIEVVLISSGAVGAGRAVGAAGGAAAGDHVHAERGGCGDRAAEVESAHEQQEVRDEANRGD